MIQGASDEGITASGSQLPKTIWETHGDQGLNGFLSPKSVGSGDVTISLSGRRDKWISDLVRGKRLASIWPSRDGLRRNKTGPGRC